MTATYEKIATTTLGSSGALSFTSIPATYTDLVLVANALGYYTSSSYDGVNVRVNNDTSNNYSYTSMEGNGTSATSSRQSRGIYGQTTAVVNVSPSNDNKFSTFVINFMNYSNTTTNKTWLVRGSAVGSNAGGAAVVTVALWNSTEAINRIDLTVYSSGGTNFLAGSMFTLYGIKAE